MRISRRIPLALGASALLVVGGCSQSPPPAPAAPAANPAAVRVVKVVKPDEIVGNWLLAVQMGNRTIEGSLHFSVERGVLAGTWTSADGREFELSKIAIDGDGVSWESDGPAGRMRASGKVDGSSMKGTMKRAPRSRDSAGGSAGSSGSGSADGSGSSGAPPPSDGDSSGSSGRGGRGRMGGRGGRGGRGGSSGNVTFTAYKSAPPLEAPVPAPTPTPHPA